MLRLLLNSETTKTNGAIKPCQTPSQKPASTLCSFAVPLNWLGPGAHPTKAFTSSRASSRNAKADFIAISSLTIYEGRGEKVSSSANLTLPSANGKILFPREMAHAAFRRVPEQIKRQG